MEINEIKKMKKFYENELIHNILFFWMPRCIDKEYGGYLNCFDNHGEKLLSYDKYVWSQGRFIWLFTKLATINSPIFNAAQRIEFMEMAKNGTNFLMKHCLISKYDWRCVFLLERDGSPKYVDGYSELDMSIYADCFVVLGLSQYSLASGDLEIYDFAKNLYFSIVTRVSENNFNMLPYPLPENYRAHGIPMILSNITNEMIKTAEVLDKKSVKEFKKNLKAINGDIVDNFFHDGFIHEIIAKDNHILDSVLGQHINPGHSIEDVWFMIEASDTLNDKILEERAHEIALKSICSGWDTEFGGIAHYAMVGKQKATDTNASAIEKKMLEQIVDGMGDKLWWVHSEALYTMLLCYFRTDNDEYLKWYNKVFDYTFSVFPNPNVNIREWIQILSRKGKPQEKVVALPVKDPFHIIRNLVQIIELLETRSIVAIQ